MKPILAVRRGTLTTDLGYDRLRDLGYVVVDVDDPSDVTLVAVGLTLEEHFAVAVAGAYWSASPEDVWARAKALADAAPPRTK